MIENKRQKLLDKHPVFAILKGESPWCIHWSICLIFNNCSIHKNSYHIIDVSVVRKHSSKEYGDYGKKRLAESPFHNLRKTKQTGVLEKVREINEREDRSEHEKIVEREKGYKD